MTHAQPKTDEAMDRSQPHEGVQISHLLQIQAQLTRAINDAREDVLSRMDESTSNLTDRINELKAKQDVANGRVSKLERTSDRLRAQLSVRLRDSAGFWHALTPAQKAKLATLATLVVTAVAEGVHRVLPLLFQTIANVLDASTK